MLISIIIPCYNQGRFLDDTLKSVQNQTYSNWECLIIDDGSEDHSAIISRNWIKKDSRFLYFKQRNAGVSAARNLGLFHAKGEWIQFLDADDYLLPSKLNRSIEMYYKDKTLNFIVTNFRHFTLDPKVNTHPFCKLQEENFTIENMLYEWNNTFSLPIHTVLLRKDLIGGTLFPLGLTAQEDWFFWIAIFKKDCNSFFIKDPLVLYRSHADSRTKNKDIYQDQLKVYFLFKQLLTREEFDKLSTVLITRYLFNNTILNQEKSSIKNSNSYQTGLMIKKILRNIGLLKYGRKLFEYIRTFKKPIY